jgi:ABC-2 type transport system ATP-binding protein
MDEMYDDIVDFAELGPFMDQKLKNYSSGMQVRLAFSVATRAKADILLIDEVLAVGDADFQRKCFEYFKKLKKDKKTVVFVSHDMTAVREYCDRAILIDKSKVIYAGTADQAAREYTRLFLRDTYELEEQAKKKKKDQQNPVAKWGVGGVDIQNLRMSKASYGKKDEVVTVSYDVMADEGFEDDIIPGILIKDARGDSICGTNSDVLSRGKKRIRIKSGETIRTTWTVPQVFNDGEYFVEPAILSSSTRQTLQWWEDAVGFRVTNEESVPYPVALDIRLEVK